MHIYSLLNINKIFLSNHVLCLNQCWLKGDSSYLWYEQYVQRKAGRFLLMQCLIMSPWKPVNHSSPRHVSGWGDCRTPPIWDRVSSMTGKLDKASSLNIPWLEKINIPTSYHLSKFKHIKCFSFIIQMKIDVFVRIIELYWIKYLTLQ